MSKFSVMLFGAWCLMLLLHGCGNSSAGASVSGVVTLDGKPLQDVVVTFHREEGGVSTGVTNQQGAYQLRSSVQQSGATPGRYSVNISPNPPGDDVDPREVVGIEIPARYNDQSELTAEVTAGANVVNFALESK